MVSMIMCNEHCIYVVQADILLLQHSLQMLEAYSRINQDAGIFCSQTVAVTATSAAQRNKLHHCSE
jgi:hypothetical protein